MKIKDQIKKRRSKYTHATLAEKLGVTRAYLTQVINGRRKSPKLMTRLEKLISKD